MSTVELYVYDLSMGYARAFSPMLLGTTLDGIWHTGVVVYGEEYFYGSDGIQVIVPKTTILGEPTRILNFGRTEVPKDVYTIFLEDLSSERYRGDRYHLFDHNCNTFSAESINFLTGRFIPSYITNLPHGLLSNDNSPIGAIARRLFDGHTITGAPVAAGFHNNSTVRVTRDPPRMIGAGSSRNGTNSSSTGHWSFSSSSSSSSSSAVEEQKQLSATALSVVNSASRVARMPSLPPDSRLVQLKHNLTLDPLEKIKFNELVVSVAQKTKQRPHSAIRLAHFEILLKKLTSCVSSLSVIRDDTSSSEVCRKSAGQLSIDLMNVLSAGVYTDDSNGSMMEEEMLASSVFRQLLVGFLAALIPFCTDSAQFFSVFGQSHCEVLAESIGKMLCNLTACEVFTDWFCAVSPIKEKNTADVDQQAVLARRHFVLCVNGLICSSVEPARLYSVDCLYNLSVIGRDWSFVESKEENLLVEVALILLEVGQNYLDNLPTEWLVHVLTALSILCQRQQQVKELFNMVQIQLDRFLQHEHARVGLLAKYLLLVNMPAN